MIAIYLLIFALSVLYLWVKHVYSYWERLGFPYIKPSIPLGNISNTWHGKKSVGKELYDLHRSSDHPVEGVYFLFRPALILRDASIIKNILSTEFASFHDRGFYCNPKEPVAASLFMKSGQDWKSLRAKLTPTFSTGKLKGMMHSIIQIADNLNQKFGTFVDNDGVIDVKDLTIRFAMDVVGTVGFGLNVSSLDDPNHSFREIEKHVNNGAIINRIRLVGAFFCPRILEILRMPSLSLKFQEYMVGIVKNTMEYREQNNVSRKDFIQLLMQLRKTGQVSNDDAFRDSEYSKTESDGKLLTIEQCAAEVALFYLAGFDTTASAIAYTLFELSRKPELQKRLQDEIDSVLAKHDDEITYESINEMPFLDMCVKESIRKYPTLPFLNRFCTKEYKIESLGLTVPKGTPLVISLLGLMRDPEYFPDPENFIPDRFSAENPMYNLDAYIPFGEGPRQCIGSRMGRIVTKTALVSIMKNYHFECIDDPARELVMTNHGLTLAVEGSLNLKTSKRCDVN